MLWGNQPAPARLRHLSSRALFGALAAVTLPAWAAPTTATTLYSFSSSDAQNPVTSVIRASDGNFYGTSQSGGASGQGSIYRLTPAGVLTTLYSFNGTDGGTPAGRLLQGRDGNFYGVTEFGGANHDGTVFQITPTGTFTNLHTFSGSDGSNPASTLVQGADGAFYGTTNYGPGIYKVGADGSFSIVATFNANNGSYPQGGLILGSDGNFYGTTVSNSNSDSTVFQLTPAGVLTTLHTFSGAEGNNVNAALAQGADGKLYGVSQNGGAYGTAYNGAGYGTVFSLTTSGSFTSLYSFSGNNGEGRNPNSPLALAGNGNLYGVAFNTVFSISGGSTVATVYSFPLAMMGSGAPSPVSLGLGADGQFYGATNDDGANNHGTVFQLNPSSTAPPTVSLSSSASTVSAGQSVTLTWSSSNAQSCSANWAGTEPTAGSATITVTGSGDHTYSLSCANDGGSVIQNVNVYVPPLPTVSLSANPTQAGVGQSSTLSWSSGNATSCTASGAWSGTEPLSGSQSVAISNAGANSYTLSCTGAGGTASASATVTGIGPPTVSFSASPSSVALGQYSNLNWSTSNASSCTASGGWSGSEPTSGSSSVQINSSGAHSFTLSCSGIGGTTAQTVTVTGVPAPTLNLSASPTAVAVGGSSTLSWSSTDATSCTASNGWSGSEPVSGSQSVVVNSVGSTTFTLACSGVGGSTTKAVSVTAVAPPTLSLSASPTSVTVGQSSTLSWSSSGASSCTASGAWSGGEAVSGSQTVTITQAGANSYTLSCSGTGGSVSQTVSVTGVPPAPTVSLSASPASVLIGQKSTLSWSSTNATSCTASGAWSGSTATSGSQAVTVAQSGGNSYTLSCTGPGGSGAQTVSVTGTLPTVAFQSAAETATGKNNSSLSVSIPLSLSATIPYAVTVPYSLGGSEPSSGYSVSPSGSASIAAGASGANLTVNVSSVKCNKTVIITLGTPTNASLGATSSNTLTLKTTVLCP